MKNFDTHCHYMPPSVGQNTMFFKTGWSDIDRHLKIMDECSVEKALLLYPTSDAHLNMGGWFNLARIYNDEIAKVVKAFPDRFMGAGILPIDNPRGIEEELYRFKSLGFKAISMASSYEGVFLSDERFYSIYEFASNHKMPIHIHAQIMNPIGEERVKDPLLSPVLEYVFDISMTIGKLMMDGIFDKFSDVKFIVAHYGGVLPLVKERFDSTYQMLLKRNFVKDLNRLPSEFFKNLYVDTSGSKSVASLLCALEIVPSSNILWGSDFPANQQMKDSASFLDGSSVDELTKRKILRENALNILL